MAKSDRRYACLVVAFAVIARARNLWAVEASFSCHDVGIRLLPMGNIFVAQLGFDFARTIDNLESTANFAEWRRRFSSVVLDCHRSLMPI
jgi:hypothetical protein